MGIPRLIKINKNRQFNYVPIYYNEQKEELEGRIKDIEMEMGVKKSDAQGNYQPAIRRGSMRGYYKQQKKTGNKASNIRLIILILFFSALAYYIFYL